MFGLIKNMFIGLITGLFNGSNHAKWISLSNKKMRDSGYSYEFAS